MPKKVPKIEKNRHHIAPRGQGVKGAKFQCQPRERCAAEISQPENSLFVLLLCPFPDVSNLHCGFIRLFPKRRIILVKGFLSESYFWKVFRWRLTRPAERLEPW